MLSPTNTNVFLTPEGFTDCTAKRLLSGRNALPCLHSDQAVDRPDRKVGEGVITTATLESAVGSNTTPRENRHRRHCFVLVFLVGLVVLKNTDWFWCALGASLGTRGVSVATATKSKVVAWQNRGATQPNQTTEAKGDGTRVRVVLVFYCAVQHDDTPYRRSMQEAGAIQCRRTVQYVGGLTPEVVPAIPAVAVFENTKQENLSERLLW